MISTGSGAARTYILGRVGPARIVRLYADGFEQLTPRERIFAWHLSRAAVAGRPIAFDQRHPRAVETLRLFEYLHRSSGRLPGDVARAVHDYLHLLWINNGFYDALTAKKFVPSSSREQLLGALRLAAGFSPLPASETQLSPLLDFLTDPERDRLLTDKTPGTDWVRRSAVNFYDRDLDLPAIERWERGGGEQYPLNSTVVRRDGTIGEDVWRAGDERHPPGRYARELQAVIGHLHLAAEFASSPTQAETIRLLVRFLRSGEQDDFRAYNRHWVGDRSRVDFILGFIEVYLDPRNRKGEWEASVYFTDERNTSIMAGLAARALEFERTSPWDDRYKKSVEQSRVANVVTVLTGTGGAGPLSPIGVNLPNEQAIRQEIGSKSILLSNVTVSSDRANGKILLHEFAFDREEIELEENYGERADMLHTALHEVIGHGSGKVSDRLQGKDPSSFFPGYYSTLEEARSDLVALWHIWNPLLVPVGAAANIEELQRIAQAMTRQAVRVALTQLRRIADAVQLEDDHMKCRQLIAHYLLEHSGGARLERRDGKCYYRVTDFAALRAGVGTLLAEIMRIKAEGDFTGGKSLVDRYGLTVDVRLRDEVQSRVRDLDVTSYAAMTFPALEPVRDQGGRVVDVMLRYPGSFAEQMREYGSLSSMDDFSPV